MSITQSEKTNQMLFSLLRCAVSGTPLTEEEKTQFDTSLLPAVLVLAESHDVAHLLALALKQNHLLPQEGTGLQKSLLRAVYRYELLHSEYEKLCQALESAGIPFIPLKGSVLRDYYPEAWMRTSCDIDILVHPEDTEKAAAVLEETCGYVQHHKGSHDISLFSPTQTHVELHYDLVEDGIANEASDVLRTVWETAAARDGFRFLHEMTGEMFLFYHLAHMAKHFIKGGCGIRPFLDLWVMQDKLPLSEEKMEALLKKARLQSFRDSVYEVVSVWFENAPHSEVTRGIESYILHGGVYGNLSNTSVMKATAGESKLRSFGKLMFMSRKNLETLYPNLVKYPFLYPFYQVWRWFRIFNPKKYKKIKHMTDVRNAVSKEDISTMKGLLGHLGLME